MGKLSVHQKEIRDQLEDLFMMSAIGLNNSPKKTGPPRTQWIEAYLPISHELAEKLDKYLSDYVKLQLTEEYESKELSPKEKNERRTKRNIGSPTQSQLPEKTNGNRPKPNYTELELAVKKGDYVSVKKLLELGVNPNGKMTGLDLSTASSGIERNAASLMGGDNYKTPLYIAIDEGHIDIAKYLLKMNIEVNRPRIPQTPLSLATQKGNKDLVELLLEKGADTNREGSGKTAICFASRDNNVEIVESLLKHSADPNSPCFSQENIAIDRNRYYQIRNARIPQYLKKEKGKKPYTYRYTSLAYAIDNGNKEMVQLLLNNGANPNINTQESWWDREIGFSYSSLARAIDLGEKEIVQLLLKSGAIDDTPPVNDSPIERAVLLKDLDILDLLIKHGTIDKDDREAALIKAVWDKNAQFVEKILQIGASSNTKQSRDKSVLIIAAEEGDFDTVEILLNHKADPNIQDVNDYTALMCAANIGNVDIVKVLLDHGAKVDIKTRLGQTALSMAKGAEVKQLLKNR